jgi:hypothetical protein
MSGTVLTTGILRLARQTATIDCRMKPPLAAAVGLIFCRSLLCQPTMPSWLTPYPGATAQMKASPSLVEATYTTDAPPDVVTAHYGKLFETQNLDFHPNLDGIGAMIRGDASECNLLITIHPQSTGTFVRVGCAAKNRSFTSASVPSAVPGPAVPAGIMERHYRLAAEMGIGKEIPAAPALPLVWPDWLVHIRGARLSIQQGADPAGNLMLKARYATSEPMTVIFEFYRDLLKAHDYPINSGLITTGQTQSGIRQNADGHVEGTNYPNGFPGPRTEIYVGFNRMHLNDPITVDMRFTTFAYNGRKAFLSKPSGQ